MSLKFDAQDLYNFKISSEESDVLSYFPSAPHIRDQIQSRMKIASRQIRKRKNTKFENVNQIYHKQWSKGMQ